MDPGQVQTEIRQYVLTKVNPVLEPLMIDLLKQRPQDVVKFTIEWMTDKGFQYQEKQNDFFKTQQEQVNQEKIEKKQSLKKQASHSDESNEEDDVEDLPVEVLVKAKNKAQRGSVSAEAFGSFNKKENFVAREIPKTAEQTGNILKRLMQSFMFQALDVRERDIVVNAMEIREFKPQEWVIQQGEDGDNLYVVEQGQLDCFKVFKKGDNPTHLKVYQPGESFGELSLLYNAPRAASIQSKDISILFALDRATFNNIVKDSAIKKREKYETVLKSIEILKSLDNYELTQICDGIRDKKFVKGEYIITQVNYDQYFIFFQGESGDTFYMIEEGQLYASKSLQPGEEPKRVFQYKPGDYFGELALLKNVPRQANVIAETDGSLVYLDSATFKRLLGPLESILARNTDRYENYLKTNI